MKIWGGKLLERETGCELFDQDPRPTLANINPMPRDGYRIFYIELTLSVDVPHVSPNPAISVQRLDNSLD